MSSSKVLMFTFGSPYFHCCAFWGVPNVLAATQCSFKGQSALWSLAVLRMTTQEINPESRRMKATM